MGEKHVTDKIVDDVNLRGKLSAIIVETDRGFQLVSYGKEGEVVFLTRECEHGLMIYTPTGTGGMNGVCDIGVNRE